MPHILAIDQGTTSTRSILFDAALRPVASAQQEFPQHFHELFNEVERAPVFDALKRWLDQRFPD